MYYIHFNLPDKPCGRWIPGLISSYGDSDLPTNLLEILLWYAKYDPNPDKDSSGMSTTQGFVEDLAFKAINSVRGTAAKAIGELIFDSELHYQFFSPHLQELCQQEINLAVRSEMAYFIIAVSNYDKNEAFTLFELLIAEQPDELLAAQWIERYINYAIFDNFDRIAPIIQRMLNSEYDFVSQAGARQACIAGLAIEDNDELIGQCIHGNIAKRKGAVDVFINNLTSELYSRKSMDYLLYLFNDEEKEIRDEAARCFYELKEQELTPYCHFIDSFIKSKAIAGNTSKIIHLLEQSIDRLPDTLLILIEQFIQCEGELSGDVRTSSAGDSYQLSELLIRLYSQTNSDEIKIRCLNVIDNMIGFGSGGLREELAQFDR